MKSKIRRKLLSALLVACMAMTLTPAAFATTEDVGTNDEAATTASTTLPTPVDNVYTLTEDVTVSALTLAESGETVYDLNGHTLTYTGGTLTIADGKTLTFRDSSVAGTTRGGTLKLTGVTSTSAAFSPESGSTVNASNIKVECSGSAFFPRGDAAAVNITNCDVTADVYCVATNAATADNYGVQINLQSSTFTANSSDHDNCPVMINVPGTLIMNNCTVTGDRQAVLVRAGDATITNCTINLTGAYNDSNNYESAKGWGSGNEVPMAAVVVGSQTSAYKADANCEITGTTIIAPTAAGEGVSVKPAIYVSSNSKSNPAYSAQLTLGNGTALTGDVVVADGTSTTPASVVVTDGASITGGITNNSTVSSVAVLNNASVSGGVSGSGSNNVYVEGDENANSNVVALNTSTGKLYSDLVAAVNAAENGETVQLLQDITLDAPSSGLSSGQGVITIDNSITLDGNGKTITAGTGFAKDAKGSRGEYHIINVANAGNVTIKNLTLEGKSASEGSVPRSGINVWSPTSATNLTVENVTVNNCSTYALTASGTNVDITVNGLNSSGNSWGGINLDTKEGSVEAVINSANIGETASIVFDKGKGATKDPVATINGGSFEYLMMGDGVTSIELTINGGAFATGELAGAVNIEDYLASGLEFDPVTGQVSRIPDEPPYTGDYNYPVTIGKTEHGTVTIAKEDQWANDGEKITVTVTPDDAYMLDKLVIKDKAGDELQVKDNGDGTYTFTMPEGAVTITATFVEDPDWVEPEPEEPTPEPSTDVTDIFSDVTPGAWYVDVVQYAYDHGLMTGTSATTFEPDATTSRAMIVSILHRLEGSPSVGTSDFSDVASGAWYADPVAWAAENGIVAGFEDGTFGPNDPITREQMASILYRYAEYKGIDTSARADLSAYSDQPSAWAQDVMEWANAEGLINGTTATTLDPQGIATRAQVAAMLQRFIENVL